MNFRKQIQADISAMRADLAALREQHKDTATTAAVGDAHAAAIQAVTAAESAGRQLGALLQDHGKAAAEAENARDGLAAGLKAVAGKLDDVMKRLPLRAVEDKQPDAPKRGSKTTAV